MKRITLLLFITTTSFLFSQNKFEAGTIEFKDGRQEKGLIEYYNKDNAEVLFKKNEEDTPKKITSNQIERYSFENFNKKFVNEKIDDSFKFLEVLVEGTATLLFLDMDGSKKRYFLKSDKSGLKELDIIIKNKNSLQNNQFKIKRYVGILSLEFNDCESIKTKVEKVRLTQSDLSKIFKEYNNCKSSVTFESERLHRENFHNLVIEGGLYFSKIKSRGTSIRGRDFDNSTNPGVGIYYVYTPTALSNRVSLSVGASYNQVKGEADYFRNVDVLIGNFRTTQIDLKTANLRLGGIYNFNKSKKKINPNFGVYYIHSIILNSDPFEAYTRIDTEGNESFLYEDFGVEMERTTSGFALEFGIDYNIHKKDYLTVKLGYEKVGDFLNYFGASYPSNTFTLKFGYSFDL